MMSAPVRTFRANASRVRCKGRTRVQMRNARMARYGHWNIHWIAPPAAERFFRGFGRSRTFGASRSACGLERCPVAERRPISSRSSTHEWLEADDDVLEASAWRLHHDLLVLGRSRPGRDPTATTWSRSERRAPSPRRARRRGTSPPRHRRGNGPSRACGARPCPPATGASMISGSRSASFSRRICDSIKP